MTPIVVDTDVISFIFKKDTRAHLYVPLLQGRKQLISFMTEAELEEWILLARWGAGRIQQFREFMTKFTSVPSSRDLILKWAEVMADAKRRGRRMDAPDAWIAATALLHDAPLITHNPKDYVGAPNLTVLSYA
jgi:predicted nucleic acid-binding protein